MRGMCLLAGLLSVALLAPVQAESSLVFGVKPGATLNSAYLGMQQGRLLPFLGLDIVGIKVSNTTTDDYTYHSEYSDYGYRELETDEYEGSALLILPQIGAKYYFKDSGIRPYLLGSVFFSMPFVSVETSNTTEYWDFEGTELVDHGIYKDSGDDGEAEDFAKEVLSFWGLTLGGGVEYFFSEHFSVGGEYGIRMLFNKVEDSDSSSNEWDSSSSTSDWNDEIDLSIKLSYSAISLNYYF